MLKHGDGPNFRFAADLARLERISYSPACDPSRIQIESLTISDDPMPGHHTARAVIYDLQPVDMVKAIAAVEARIRAEWPCFRRTGWRAASDSLYVHFSASTPHTPLS